MPGEQLPLMVTAIRHRRSAECHPAREYFAQGLCSTCYSKAATRERRKEFREAGLCMRCGDPRDASGRVRCAPCREQGRLAARRNKETRPALYAQHARNASYNWRRTNLRSAMLVSARHRARKFGFEFALTRADIDIPETCPVLGVKLTVGAKNSPTSPSLDRIDNSRGYVPGNVWVISARANRLKADASLDELRRLVSALERHSP